MGIDTSGPRGWVSWLSSPPLSFSMFGVGAMSGATQFTRIASGASSIASERANWATAAFAAE
jgi:hypothetical protein